MQNYTVREYLTFEQKCPYRTWLKTLDRKTQARIQARIMRFEKGNFGDHKSVGEGVMEARMDFGPGFRLYFGLVDKTVVLLITGGDKHRQARDIEKAKTYWNDYQERKNDDG